ncbi:MAG: response regulator transcription factor [Deinococcota bacterium]
MSASVLIVEDDESVRELLAFHLSQAGFRTNTAATAKEGWDLVSSVDVVVLDWMLPDESGLAWLMRLRSTSKYERKPVLILTARATETDKVTGLGSGADDYMTKPFSAAELVARLKALLRRTATRQAQRIGELYVDPAQGVVSLAGERLQLTRREFELLECFAAHPGRVFSRTELLDRVWGEDFLGTERTVDQHVAQLRSLIGAGAIETVRGRGYRLALGDGS